MKYLIILLFTTLTTLSFANEEGKELHDESCLSCHIADHTEEFYTNPERIVKDLFGLKSQVSRCVGFFNTGWFPEEQTQVIEYLNSNFYHFAKSE